MTSVTQPIGINDRRPSNLGPVHLVDLLGRGGMGTVYKAERTVGEPRVVALKVAHGIHCKQPDQRLLHEITTMALLDHAHVVRAYEAGRDVMGRSYFTMEFVDGQPITRYCAGSSVALVPRLKLFLQVCEGMIHVHGKGVIHGDIKPGNILVVERSDGPTAKIIDFGLARLYGDVHGPVPGEQPAAPLGSPAYMSPESTETMAGKGDPRSDIYAMGAVLFELITETPVIDPQRFQGTGLEEALRLIRQADRPRISQRLSGLKRQSVFDDLTRRGLVKLDQIVARALAVDPSRRYTGAASLKRDLEGFIALHMLQHVG